MKYHTESKIRLDDELLDAVIIEIRVLPSNDAGTTLLHIANLTQDLRPIYLSHRFIICYELGQCCDPVTVEEHDLGLYMNQCAHIRRSTLTISEATTEIDEINEKVAEVP